jgi:hypothetical protein
VELDGDPAALDALGQHPVQHLGHRLGGGRPLLGEPGGPHRALDLGSAGQDADLAEDAQQVAAEPPALGRLHPAAEADGGGGDRHVGGAADQFLGGGEEFTVVGERHDPQCGGVDDVGPAPLEERAEFLGPAGGGHSHGETGQRAVGVLRSLQFLVFHPALVPLSSRCRPAVTSCGAG